MASRIITKPSGRRERVTLVGNRIISRSPLPKRKRQTRTASRLNRRRRRIGR